MERKRTYTIAEAAELAGMSRKAVARRVERGSLRSVIRNGRRLIPRSELVRAGLLPDEGNERGGDMDAAGLPAPAPAPGPAPVESNAALVNLVRELMDRVERQATEIAQFRALTVQAESLRADRELAELRARLASLESRAEAPPRTAPASPTRPRPHADTAPAATGRRQAGIWLPPSAAARPGATPAAAPDRRFAADASPPRGGEPRWSRGAIAAVEAAFIVLVALLAGLAGLRPLYVVLAVATAWALVAAAEVVARYGRRNP